MTQRYGTTLGQTLPGTNHQVVGKDLYGYAFVFPIAELITDAIIPKTVNIQNDSYFLWTKATYFARINSTAALTYSSRIVPQVTFEWTDTSSGRGIFNVPIFIQNFWGFGDIPMILPEPKLLVPRSSLTIECTNVHDTEDYELFLLMLGTKIFIA